MLAYIPYMDPMGIVLYNELLIICGVVHVKSQQYYSILSHI